MKITVITNKSADKTEENYNCDLIVCADNGEVINFKKELSGDCEKLLKIGRYSKTNGCAVIGGYTTDNYGIIRRSAVISDKGALLGISDMNLSFSEDYSLGYGYRTYTTACGKIGVIIGDDLFSLDAIETLVKSDADVIVVVGVMLKNTIILSILQTYGYLFSVPIICALDDGITFVSADGGIIRHSKEQVVTEEIDIKKKFTSYVVKRRTKR